MKSKIQRGDVYYADLRPVVGCEQGGIRPVLIVQNNAGNQHSPTVIAAAITSRREHRLPTHIPVRERTKGLKQNSVILLEQIRTLDRKRLKDYIGQVNTMTMQEVDQAIAVSFGLDGFLAQNREGEERQVRIGMEQKRLAWIYCAIDAPEDTHGALKEQLKQLCDYAEQMGMETVGSSSDLGGKPLWERMGFGHFCDAVLVGKASTLLVMGRSSLFRSGIQQAWLQGFIREQRAEVYSPLDGRMEI